LHGGLRGEVPAELTAGYERFEDRVAGVTPTNLVKLLFMSKVDTGRRLVRLGLFPGFPDAAADALADGPVRRMPEQRAADKRA